MFEHLKLAETKSPLPHTFGCNLKHEWYVMEMKSANKTHQAQHSALENCKNLNNVFNGRNDNHLQDSNTTANVSYEDICSLHSRKTLTVA